MTDLTSSIWIDVAQPSAARLRAQHGAVTRRAILSAARALFRRKGYAQTTMKQIAGEAGTAVQTIYTAFGSKAGILLALVDLLDEEAGVAPLIGEMMTAGDPRDALGLFARVRRLIRERCGDIVTVLRAGAPAEADLAAAWAEGMRRRHHGLERVVGRLAEAGALRPGLDPARAVDIAAAVVTDDACDVLVEQRGWTFDEYEAWLRQTLELLLLGAAR